MSKIRLCGGKILSGTVQISGAKNAALPILAASLLAAQGESEISSVPRLNDVAVMIDLLQHLGVLVETDGQETIYLQAGQLSSNEAPYQLVSRMRASVLIMGPLLARLGSARVSLPGGCAIGSRPIDLHLKGFAALGADIVVGHGFVEASAAQLRGTTIYLDYPSVGATENLLSAAVLARGTTVLENAAAEPEIVDLVRYLRAMGAQISGEGTDRIEIVGVPELRGVAHRIIPDRIEAGTYLIGAALCGGEIRLQNVEPDHLRPLLAKLAEGGVQVREDEDHLLVRGTRRLQPLDVQTLPHPGFPTDLQPQMMALLTQADGASLVVETVFENRFMHVPELVRMGADIKVNGRQAVVRGPTELTGVPVAATDLRAGAALVLAGLAATGETIVAEAHHIDRGYSDIVGKLQGLGAQIERIPD